MKSIRYYTEPEFKNPVMLTSWPGMGAVASQAVDYIRRKLKVELFAEIETKDFIVANSVSVVKGLASFPRSPRIFLFYCKEYDLIICESEEQFSGKYVLDVIQRIFKVVQDTGIKTIYTGAAFVQHMRHSSEPDIYVVANTSGLLEDILKKTNLKILTKGQVSGLNGTILGFASERNIEAACFLATIPVYGINFPNPRASKSIVQVWQKLIGFDIDYSSFNISITEADKALDIIEEQLKRISVKDDLSLQENDIPEIKINTPEKPEEVPPAILQEIEELFSKARKDKAKANKLKEVLDRWDLFPRYENRFLDLFREGS